MLGDGPGRDGMSRSPLARLLPEPATSAETLDALRRRAWIEMGVAVLRPDEIADAWTRQAVVNEANKRFGRRAEGRRR